MADLLVAFVDPFKIILLIYLVFRPKGWPLAIGLGVAIALAEAAIGHALGASKGGHTFFEAAPSHLVAGIVMAAAGNLIGRKRLQSEQE